jgi:hypothetical protein
MVQNENKEAFTAFLFKRPLLLLLLRELLATAALITFGHYRY